MGSGPVTRISLAHCQHPGGEAAEAGIGVGCLAQPRKVRGLSQGCRRDDDETTDVSPSLQNDPCTRGSGCASETLCAARRVEVARARETLCACHGRRSRIAGALHELWAILVVHSTCDDARELITFSAYILMMHIECDTYTILDTVFGYILIFAIQFHIDINA